MKLLLLGDVDKTDRIIELAKARGVYTILTDNLGQKKSKCKLIADESWDISVYDTDTLEKLSIERGITAITCGASENCMDATRKLCKRLNLPFYVSDYAWEITNDKLKFKQLCRQYGIPVVKEYMPDISLGTKEMEHIEYPVVVKPTDSCSSIGFHLCENEQDLINGYRDAYHKSKTNRVVIEKFYSGVEISLIFGFNRGEPYLIEAGATFGDRKDDIPFVFGYGPADCLGRLEKELFPQLSKLFNELGCYEGIACIQVIFEGDEYAVTEMNYRLPGGASPIQDYMCQIVLDYALNEDYLASISQPEPVNVSAYLVSLKPGKIASVEGVESIRELPGIAYVKINMEDGTVIEPDSGMRRIFCIIVSALPFNQFKSQISTINELLKVTDENGNDMVMRFILDENNNVIDGGL
ncbi:ATP-grasp domain-containing protein [Butyrivibrio sp. WCD2001]|uniref:ATP-grasp domain-containing protein n=1 Tax=Butyrivibrio sp. WCD2001 TaxID=1280681 RepID=UPI000417AD51|nr:ATP-grasp domain-containing protein [Butyrivibrio sp. WCD2001]